MDEGFSLVEKLIAFIGSIVAIIVFISLIPGIGVYAFVGAGHVGVVTRFGAVDRVVQPGIVFKLPLFIEWVNSMETRTQLEQTDASAASKDLQEVRSTVALNFRLNGEKAVDVYQQVGNDYKSRVVAPALQEAFKSATARFTANELIDSREEVKKVVLEDLKGRLARYNIIADDFNIVNFDFSDEFNQAIENKVRAQQELEKARVDAETQKTIAQGQSDAQKILRDDGGLSPEYLQFYALQKWNGTLPYSTSAVPFVPLPTPNQ